MSAEPARKSALPAHVELQLARLVEAAPAGPDWLHVFNYAHNSWGHAAPEASADEVQKMRRSQSGSG